MLPDEIITSAAHRVGDVYADAETVLMQKTTAAVARGLARANTDEDAGGTSPYASLYSEVTTLRREARQVANQLDAWAKGTLPATIEDAAELGSTAVEQSLPPGINFSARNAVNTRAVEALSREVYTKSNRVHVNILRNVDDQYRQIVGDIVGRTVLGAATREEAAVLALAKFSEQGITVFTDRAGRNWKMSSYVEMATRSAAMRSLNQGSNERMQAEGLDLVRISSHRGCSDRCAPYQGRVLSLSGNNVGNITVPSELDGSPVKVRVVAGLDRAKERGLFGPNCRHTTSAFIPGVKSAVPPIEADPQEYADTQELRRLEREVRKQRNKEATALTPSDKATAKRKVAEGRARIAEHVERTGVPRRPDRERITGKFAVRGDPSKAPASLPKRGSLIDMDALTPPKPAAPVPAPAPKPTPKAPTVLTEAQGRARGREVWHDYADALDTETVEHVRTYTGNAFDIINGSLRDGAKIPDNTVAAARGLDRAIENAPRVPEPIRVSRDVGADVYGLADDSDISTIVGNTYKDEGFLSTAMQSALAPEALNGVVSVSRGTVELRLDVPEGTKALYVSSHPKNTRGLAAYGPEENELILGRGVAYELYDAIIEDGKRVLLGRITAQQPTKDVL